MDVELPDLGRLDPRRLEPSSKGLKRRNSANAEKQGRSKRQFVGNAYDEISRLALRAFGPVIYTCQDFEAKTFEYDYVGKDRYGNVGPVRLVFRTQLDGTRSADGARSFVLTFRMADALGPFDVWGVMLRSGAQRPMRRIPCGLKPLQVRHEIEEAIYAWLDFASQHFVQ